MEDISGDAELLQSWDDSIVLSWEPLCSKFLALHEQNSRGKCLESFQVALAKELVGDRRHCGCPRWRRNIEAWLDLVFHPDYQDKRKKCVPLNWKMATIFVQCFWKLDTDEKSAARKLINDARRNAGYSTAFNEHSRADRTAQAGIKRAASESSKQPPNKRRRNLNKLPTAALPTSPPQAAGASLPENVSVLPCQLPTPPASAPRLGIGHRPATPPSPLQHKTEDVLMSVPLPYFSSAHQIFALPTPAATPQSKATATLAPTPQTHQQSPSQPQLIRMDALTTSPKLNGSPLRFHKISKRKPAHADQVVQPLANTNPDIQHATPKQEELPASLSSHSSRTNGVTALPKCNGPSRPFPKVKIQKRKSARLDQVPQPPPNSSPVIQNLIPKQEELPVSLSSLTRPNAGTTFPIYNDSARPISKIQKRKPARVKKVPQPPANSNPDIQNLIAKQEESPTSLSSLLVENNVVLQSQPAARSVESKPDPDIDMQDVIIPTVASSDLPLTPSASVPVPHMWSPRDSIVNKLILGIWPPIWAQSRQEVCESTDWFRSYQGGVYHSGGKVKGYLLGGFPSFRDAWLHDGKLIISHGGGKADSLHTTKGKVHRCADDDQLAQDKSVRALLNNYQSKTPLVLLIDDKYAFFPYDLASRNITYTALGVYMITYAWVEYDPSKTNEKGKVMRYKFAFQWCEGQGEPWWHTAGTSSGVSVKSEPPIVDVRNFPAPGPTPGQLTAHDTLSPPLSQDVNMDHVNMKDMDSARRDVKTFSTQDSTIPSNVTPPFIGNRALRLESLLNFETQVTVDSIALPRIESTSSNLPPRDIIFSECTTCHLRSCQIYEPGFTCLQPQCAMFWKTSSGLDYVPEAFHLGFTQLSPDIKLGKNDALKDIRPQLPKTDSDNPTNSIFLHGWHCSNCGRLSCRSKWECWECESCKTEVQAGMRIQDLKNFRTSKVSSRLSDGFSIHPSSNITRGQTFSWRYPTGDWSGSCTTYILPDHIGCIHHIEQNKFDERATDIFDKYQQQANEGDIKFRRWPMRAHKCRGKLLTNYFSQNCGEPYHYVGGTENTIPFDKAGSAVSDARQLIQERIHQALGKDAPFNEILSAAYMQSQKMAFHSDAERGLGPLVAGLSLGSPAVMHFRPIKSARSQERRTIVLSIVLRHGDVLVMDGAQIQHRYQHTVVPSDFRIAATARFINPGHTLSAIKPETSLQS